MSKYLLKVIGTDEIINIVEWNGSGSLVAPTGYEFEPFSTEDTDFINYFETITVEDIPDISGNLFGQFTGELTGSILFNGETFDELIHKTKYGELRLISGSDIQKVSESYSMILSTDNIIMPVLNSLENKEHIINYKTVFDKVIDENISNYVISFKQKDNPNIVLEYLVHDTQLTSSGDSGYYNMAASLFGTASFIHDNYEFFNSPDFISTDWYIDFDLGDRSHVGKFYGEHTGSFEGNYRGEIGGEKLENVLGITVKTADAPSFRYKENVWNDDDVFLGIPGDIPSDGYFMFNEDASIMGDGGANQWGLSTPTKIRLDSTPFDSTLESFINLKNKLFDIIKNKYAGSILRLDQEVVSPPFTSPLPAYKEFEIENVFYFEKRIVNGNEYFYRLGWGDSDLVEVDDDLGYFSMNIPNPNSPYYKDKEKYGFFEISVNQINPPADYSYENPPIQDDKFKVYLEIKNKIKQVRTFTTSGEYTIPSWAKKITIYSVGAGGGGGAGSNGFGHHLGTGIELDAYYDLDLDEYVKAPYEEYGELALQKYYNTSYFQSKIGHDAVTGGGGGAGGSVVVAEYLITDPVLTGGFNDLEEYAADVQEKLLQAQEDLATASGDNVREIRKLKLKVGDFQNKLNKINNELEGGNKLAYGSKLKMFVGSPGKGGKGRTSIQDHGINDDIYSIAPESGIFNGSAKLVVLPLVDDTNKWRSIQFQREFPTLDSHTPWTKQSNPIVLNLGTIKDYDPVNATLEYGLDILKTYAIMWASKQILIEAANALEPKQPTFDEWFNSLSPEEKWERLQLRYQPDETIVGPLKFNLLPDGFEFLNDANATIDLGYGPVRLGDLNFLHFGTSITATWSSAKDYFLTILKKKLIGVTLTNQELSFYSLLIDRFRQEYTDFLLVYDAILKKNWQNPTFPKWDGGFKNIGDFKFLDEMDGSIAQFNFLVNPSWGFIRGDERFLAALRNLLNTAQIDPITGDSLGIFDLTKGAATDYLRRMTAQSYVTITGKPGDAYTGQVISNLLTSETVDTLTLALSLTSKIATTVGWIDPLVGSAIAMTLFIFKQLQLGSIKIWYPVPTKYVKKYSNIGYTLDTTPVLNGGNTPNGYVYASEVWNVPDGLEPNTNYDSFRYKYTAIRETDSNYYTENHKHSPDWTQFHGKHGGDSMVYLGDTCIINASGGIGGTGGYAYRALLNPITRVQGLSSNIYDSFIVPGGYGPKQYPYAIKSISKKISHGGPGAYGISAPSTVHDSSYHYIYNPISPKVAFGHMKNLAPVVPSRFTPSELKWFTTNYSPVTQKYGKTSTNISSLSYDIFELYDRMESGNWNSTPNTNTHVPTGVYDIDGEPYKDQIAPGYVNGSFIMGTQGKYDTATKIPTPPGGGGGHGVHWQMLDRRSRTDSTFMKAFYNNSFMLFDKGDHFKNQSLPIADHLYLGLGGINYHTLTNEPAYLVDEIDSDTGLRTRITIGNGGNGAFGNYTTTDGILLTGKKLIDVPNKIYENIGYTLAENVSTRWGVGGGGGAAYYETNWNNRPIEDSLDLFGFGIPSRGSYFYDPVQNGADGGPGVIVIVAESEL